ncbi:hypothetical protein TanjilG_17304 [Lupinus angustifolius]|uniref:F-box protein n=1 Tax=Lupinus angustifolius TaxID=3871 RepID=A0A4P1R1Z2_LUPAN|nr:PREDICTED: uncharacterized protein LOC109325930 [Lupinus angustifolius]OIV99494.1 hypothetical protein TanjilG_17304 [Lupinus angustifolius]
MPNDTAHACHEGVDAQVMHGYQSVFMPHWTHMARNRLSNGCEVREIKEDSDAEKRDGGSEVAKDGSVHAGSTGEVDRDTRVTYSNEAHPGKSKKTSLYSKSFSIFRKKTNGISSLKREWVGVPHRKDPKIEIEAISGDDNVSLYRTRSHLLSTSAHAPPRTETLARKYQLLSRDTSPVPPLMNSWYTVEQNNLAVSTSLWNGFVKPASDIVRNGHDKGKTSVPPSTPGQHEVYQSSYKCSEDSENSSTSQVVITSVGEDSKRKLVYAALPDINQEPPEVLTLACPVALACTLADRETSTSITNSLYAEHLLSHADGHSRSKSGNSSLGSDPSSRWVKRLKLCPLSSAHGTRSATIEEITLHEKVNNIFSKMKGNKTNLEPKMAYHAEVQMVPDLCATVLTNGNSSSTKEKKTAASTLLHPWIRRWSRNHDVSPQKRHELAELRKPKSSNTPEEFQKKQFPSIAAMAMMGKAMNCLNPSELMKKGPVVVWNVKGF